MKNIFFILLLCNLTACKQSTEGKIASAIDKIEKSKHSNLKYIKIDSVNYSLGTLMEYYFSFANKKHTGL